jgi:hypothetical protein
VENTCQPILCALYGCGFSVTGIVCAESTATAFLCTCPGRDATTVLVEALSLWKGCEILSTDREPTVKEILSDVNTNHETIEGYVAERVPEITDVTVDSVAENTITLTLTADRPVADYVDKFKDVIADFIGKDDVGRDEVQVDEVSSTAKRVTDQVLVTVGSAGTLAVPLVLVLGSIVRALL